MIDLRSLIGQERIDADHYCRSATLVCFDFDQFSAAGGMYYRGSALLSEIGLWELSFCFPPLQPGRLRDVSNQPDYQREKEDRYEVRLAAIIKGNPEDVIVLEHEGGDRCFIMDGQHRCSFAFELYERDQIEDILVPIILLRSPIASQLLADWRSSTA